eukprot:2837541-Prorocentrum_lima.AAC.1
MRAACGTASAQGDTRGTFWQYAEHMRTTAIEGGLLELRAACTEYCMQAVVCARAEDRFIVIGQEGRGTATFLYEDGFWDLLKPFVRLPSRA